MPPEHQTMNQILKLFGLTMVLCLIAGCATQSKDAAQSGPSATCYVCRYNNDLACVNIHVKDKTPRTEYQATTYYFCSEDCREAFVKNPQKYLPKAQKP